jgi:hypothetical protein
MARNGAIHIKLTKFIKVSKIPKTRQIPDPEIKALSIPNLAITIIRTNQIRYNVPIQKVPPVVVFAPAITSSNVVILLQFKPLMVSP